jgi:hypothetical protein
MGARRGLWGAAIAWGLRGARALWTASGTGMGCTEISYYPLDFSKAYNLDR